jgi:hypothetical protein
MSKNNPLTALLAQKAALEKQLAEVSAKTASPAPAQEVQPAPAARQSKYTEEQKAQWIAMRSLSAEEVKARIAKNKKYKALLKALKPERNWLWLTLGVKPDEETRAFIKSLGFHWAPRSNAWQHPCGYFKKTYVKPDGK